ncbi:hypothetical protein SOMG_04652 [Schizosaccharomyces osmophilus]|uniref:Uncharacterized protein n=1 Tax=Schizosaccharomyces osmophilus TaxID=2545709 RepID=A0AAE9WFP8_9SCHI|nr:uncharacterized protein SOMG_04652 [Schizosaccharomyces osmophilus]WBW74799.1 hypothetical protein SOMG_04652 [Schizosaccharomyces osmophilus]
MKGVSKRSIERLSNAHIQKKMDLCELTTMYNGILYSLQTAYQINTSFNVKKRRLYISTAERRLIPKNTILD